MDILYKTFVNPPAEARPFVRWWWAGGAVDKAGITRELELMAEAGIGGVEINTLRPARDNKPEKRWLSSQWTEMVKFACEEAKRLGIIADIIGGAGWPFGCPELETEEGSKSVRVLKKTVNGPSVIASSMKDFSAELIRASSPVRSRNEYERAWKESPAEAEFHSMRLVPIDSAELTSGTDLSRQVNKDGSFRIEIPEGEYTLYLLLLKKRYRDIMNWTNQDEFAARLDHLNPKAVQRYLGLLGDCFTSIFGENFGQYLRSIICDSFEMGEEYYTHDFLEQFRQRRDYDLLPWLPLVQEAPEFKETLPYAEDLRRITFDTWRTVQELMQERFIEPFTEWCNKHGVKSRVQAYGRPWTDLEGKMAVDISEGECWMWQESPAELQNWLWSPSTNKEVASASHLAGNPVVSCETFTAPKMTGKITLDHYKQGTDMLIMTGINNLILHGRGYSPADKPFPGWIIMGTFVSHHNTWWPHFRKWTDYTARLSALSQQTKHCASIALLGPEVDGNWKYTDDSYRFPWHQSEDKRDFPVHLTEFWKALQQCGYNMDFINEHILENAGTEKGRLTYRAASYKAIIVLHTKRMKPEAAQALQRYAENGGIVIFAGSVPDQSHGWFEADKNDQLVRETMTELCSFETATTKPLPENGRQMQWVFNNLPRLGVYPDVEISSPTPSLFQTMFKDGERDIGFFNNSSHTEIIEVRAKFNTGTATPWLWDPETGERTPFAFEEIPSQLELKLNPLESALIVFEPGSCCSSPKKKKKKESLKSEIIDGPWDVTFHPQVGSEFNLTIPKLEDLGSSDNEALRTFSGCAIYRKTLHLENPKIAEIDLGKVFSISELFINGKKVATHWYGKHSYSIEELFREGENHLEIRVTTPLYNYLTTIRNTAPEFGYPIADTPPEPSGLIGPVCLSHNNYDAP